ncbi:MAG: hypothetical protein Q9222_003431 [Ikaeria aurantiellina]
MYYAAESSILDISFNSLQASLRDCVNASDAQQPLWSPWAKSTVVYCCQLMVQVSSIFNGFLKLETRFIEITIDALTFDRQGFNDGRCLIANGKEKVPRRYGLPLFQSIKTHSDHPPSSLRRGSKTRIEPCRWNNPSRSIDSFVHLTLFHPVQDDIVVFIASIFRRKQRTQHLSLSWTDPFAGAKWLPSSLPPQRGSSDFKVSDPHRILTQAPCNDCLAEVLAMPLLPPAADRIAYSGCTDTNVFHHCVTATRRSRRQRKGLRRVKFVLLRMLHSLVFHGLPTCTLEKRRVFHALLITYSALSPIATAATVPTSPQNDLRGQIVERASSRNLSDIFIPGATCVVFMALILTPAHFLAKKASPTSVYGSLMTILAFVWWAVREDPSAALGLPWT